MIKAPHHLIKVKLNGKTPSDGYKPKYSHKCSLWFLYALYMHDYEYKQLHIKWLHSVTKYKIYSFRILEEERKLVDKNLRHNIQVLSSFEMRDTINLKNHLVSTGIFKKVFGYALSYIFYFWYRLFGNIYQKG